MPTYTYECSRYPAEHHTQHVKRPMADRDLPTGELCRLCGADMKRALEAPFRSPEGWARGAH